MSKPVPPDNKVDNAANNTASNAPSRQQIQRVVQRFYQKLMQDPQLAPFFSHIDDFTEHEQRISDFWTMSMGGKLEQPPKIDMIGKHFPLGIKAEDLQHWLALFSETLGEELPQQQALMWMDKAMTIAARMQQIVIDNQAMGVQIKDPD